MRGWGLEPGRTNLVLSRQEVSKLLTYLLTGKKPRASEVMHSILQRGEGRVKRLEGQLCLLLTRACAAQTLRAAELTAQELWSFPGNGGVRKRTSERFVGVLLRLLFLLQLTIFTSRTTRDILADAAL